MISLTKRKSVTNTQKNVKEINKIPELFDEKETSDPNVFMGEVSISVSTMSFLATVVFFLIGLLMNNKSADKILFIKLRLPMMFLFISAFGFLYSTLIYGNASGDISRLNRKNFSKQMTIANIISEYIGVYMLCYAMPILVLGYSPDKTLSAYVLVIEVIGFSLYHIFGYSVIERYFSKPMMYIWLISGIGLQVSSFISFYYYYELYYYILTFLLVFHVLLITIISIIKGDEVDVVGKSK